MNTITRINRRKLRPGIRERTASLRSAGVEGTQGDTASRSHMTISDMPRTNNLSIHEVFGTTRKKRRSCGDLLGPEQRSQSISGDWNCYTYFRCSGERM